MSTPCLVLRPQMIECGGATQVKQILSRCWGLSVLDSLLKRVIKGLNGRALTMWNDRDGTVLSEGKTYCQN